MQKSVFWNSYLSPGLDNSSLLDKFSPYKEGFSRHRETIACMIEMLAPDSVAILGSWFLKDIPISELIKKHRDIYFVDWIENISQPCIARTIVH